MQDLHAIGGIPAVMKYLLEFGYKVIPVNPFSVGKKVNGETIVEKLEDISSQIDIVNVFRPSKETPDIAKNAIEVRSNFFIIFSRILKIKTHKYARNVKKLHIFLWISIFNAKGCFISVAWF